MRNPSVANIDRKGASVERIYHITTSAAWGQAQAAGSYRESTRGLSLDEVGFIHCSYADQVPRVAQAYYADLTDLVLLTIDPERLTAELREDALGDTGEMYPHIYGPVNLDAVVDVARFNVPG